MKLVSKIAVSITCFITMSFANCPKVVIIAPEFSEKTLGIEYRGKDVQYASTEIANAVASTHQGSKIMTESELQVMSATCKPEQIIRLRVASYSLEPKFKTARYAVLNITGPKWFGVNLPLKWVVRYFVKETTKESTTPTAAPK